MNKFIQKNWFKLSVIIILLLTGLAIAYYFVFSLPKYQKEQANNNSFSYQEKCANAANNFFTKNGYAENGIEESYISHWNKSLNKCFILFSHGLGGGPTLGGSIFYELADALEGTEYAEIEWVIPNENSPGWCTLYPSGNGVSSISKSCSSKSEFDSFVKSYMQE